MSKRNAPVSADDAREAAKQMLRRGASPDHLVTFARSLRDGDAAAAIKGVADSARKRR